MNDDAQNIKKPRKPGSGRRLPEDYKPAFQITRLTIDANKAIGSQLKAARLAMGYSGR